MPYDQGLAELMRDALLEEHGISEKKMFGGLCFLKYGNMLSGIMQDGGMLWVGKDNEAKALAIAGIRPLSFTGRKMGGIVEFDGDFIESAEFPEALALALDFVNSLPPK